MNDERDEIRARIDIVQLVGSSVRLERKGKSYKGLCPFHADKTPSFDVSPDTGRYTCWSCGEKGDIFTWVMKTQNVEFPEALRTLAKMAGVTLSERHRGTDSSQREVHQAAMAAAQAFFREQLQASEAAKAYCTRRGLTNDVLGDWGIGFSPEGGEALTARLLKKGLPLAECKAVFLVDQDPSGGYYDKFRGRLMFPIWNEKGELVAFGGRILGSGEPKYINSSDTPLYRKSKVLYGMNRARDSLQKTRRAVLVEGYLDVIACHRAGVTSALASLGTAMSDDQAKLLKRWVEEVVVLYDSDSAGQKAADRASRLLLAEGLKVRIALMPEGQDPDTLLATLGAEAVVQAVEQGLSPLDYRLQALERRLSPKEPEFWAEAVAILAEAPTELELDRHVVRLAHQHPGATDALRAQKSLRNDVRGFKAGQPASVRTSPAPASASRKPEPIGKSLTAAEIVLFRAFIDEALRVSGWQFAIHPEFFSSDQAVRLAEAIRAAYATAPPAGPMARWLHQIEPEEMQVLLGQLVLDPRGDFLSEQIVADAVVRLRNEMERREIDNARANMSSSAERQEILNRIRKMKPDTREKQASEELY